MRIDLRLLRQAQALATHGTFSRAAEALGISQPTLSRGIKDLEARVGLPLFTRTPTGVDPTDFGLMFLARAADVTGPMDDLEREVALAKGLQGGEITVGMGAYAAQILAADAIARFVASHPQTRVRLVVGAWESLLPQLRARACEFVVAEASVFEKESDLESMRRLRPLRGYMVARAGHPLARKPGLRLEDVFEYPFVQVIRLPPRLLKPILGARSAMPGSAAQPNAAFPAIECPSVGLAIGVVSRTDAVTLATLGSIADDLEGRRLVPLLHEPWMHTGFGVVRLRRRTLSPAGAALLEAIEAANELAQREGAALERRWTVPAGRGAAGRRVRHTGRSGGGGPSID